MAQISASDFLTASEVIKLREILSDEIAMSGLRKVFGFDARFDDESMRNEALSSVPNVHRIIQFAAGSRKSRGFVDTIRSRMDALTVRQTGQKE